MNPSVSLISFLLFVLTTNLPIGFSEPVLDFQRVPLSPEQSYYIIPASETGGGIWVDAAGNQNCPVTVIQDLSEVERGMAVRFIVKNGDGAILTGTPLDIEFVEKPTCATSAKVVVVVDNFPDKWLGIGTAKDHQGAKQIITTGTFNFQKFNLGYKIVFCPTTAPNCYNIARQRDEDGYRLILSNSGVSSFKFIKA